MEKPTVYLSLGGNQGDVLSRCRQALILLSEIGGLDNFRHSHFYLTQPIQVDTSDLFVNCACSFETALPPHEIFRLTQEIETQLGKVPKAKTESRPIDIDLLFYGHGNFCDRDLEIPHPRWKERLFVLIPLADLTEYIDIESEDGLQHYVLQDIIQPLLNLSPDSISLIF